MTTRRIGGGYGGKTTRASCVNGAAAVAAYLTGRQVHVQLDRVQDMQMVGGGRTVYARHASSMQLRRSQAVPPLSLSSVCVYISSVLLQVGGREEMSAQYDIGFDDGIVQPLVSLPACVVPLIARCVCRGSHPRIQSQLLHEWWRFRQHGPQLQCVFFLHLLSIIPSPLSLLSCRHLSPTPLSCPLLSSPVLPCLLSSPILFCSLHSCEACCVSSCA